MLLDYCINNQSSGVHWHHRTVGWISYRFCLIAKQIADSRCTTIHGIFYIMFPAFIGCDGVNYSWGGGEDSLESVDGISNDVTETFCDLADPSEPCHQ